MPSITFKISDNQKFDFLFSLLNPNFNEEGGWVIEYAICDVYDEYAIARNYAEGVFERIYYTKNDENDSLEITNKERCYIVDVNESEKAALASLKGESTYEQAVEAFAEKDATISSLNEQIGTLTTDIETERNTVANLTEENSQYSTKIAELETTNSTLIMERDEARDNYSASLTSYSELNGNYNAVVAERDALATYKHEVETNAKKAVVECYVEHLAEEVIETYMNNLDNYTIEDLDMKLTYELKKANPGLFSKQAAPAAHAYIPKDEGDGRGINDILAKYEKH